MLSVINRTVMTSGPAASVGNRPSKELRLCSRRHGSLLVSSLTQIPLVCREVIWRVSRGVAMSVADVYVDVTRASHARVWTVNLVGETVVGCEPGTGGPQL